MTDIATLGLAVDSRPVTAATAALNQFAAAAAPAASGANALQKAAAAAATTLPAVVKGTTAATAGTNALGQSTKAARADMINFSRQVQDVGVSLASGQSPFLVLIQQGTQVADIFASSQVGAAGFAKQILGLVTPMRALAVGAAAVGLAGYAMNSSWKSSALQFDDTARAAGSTISALRELQAVAAFKGIDKGDFLEASEKFGRNIYQARNNMGGLAEVFRANGKVAGDFATSLGHAADIIKNARGDTQKQFALLTQMGLPATMEWVRLLQGGSDGLRKAQQEAVKWGGIAEESLIAKARQYDEAWAKAWTNFGNNGASAFVRVKAGASDVFGWISDKIGGLYSPSAVFKQEASGGGGNRMSQSAADAFYDATGADRSASGKKPSVDPAAERKRISDAQQYLGLLGSTITAEESRRQVTLQMQAAAMDGIGIDAKRVELLKQIAAENVLGITSIKTSADAYRIEAETVGMSTGAATAYAAAQNALNEAKRRGMELRPAEIEAIRREASALGEAAQRAETMKFGYESLVRGPMQTFRSELANGATFFDALKASGISALNALSEKLMDMAAQGLWSAAFGGKGGGGGGIGGLIASLIGGAGGGGGDVLAGAASIGMGGIGHAHGGAIVGKEATFTRDVDMSVFAGARRMHGGGVVGKDEVPIVAKRREGVFTPEQMKALSPAGGAPIINVTQNNDFRGADPNSEARIRQGLEATKTAAVNEALAQFNNIRNNNPTQRARQ